MAVKDDVDLKRLCIHTMTTKPWPLTTAIKKYAAAHVAGITVWRQWFDRISPSEAGRLIREAGIGIVSLCRGGFFASRDAQARNAALDENRRIIDEAVALGAPMIVLVCGADPRQPLIESRKQITDAIFSIEPYAAAAGIKLAVEPLHPMYADTRSAINTMGQANELCEHIDSPNVGIAVDVYHVWWDSGLENEIARCAQARRLFAFHVCDWLSPTTDLLNDRGLMGDGCIDIERIRKMMEAGGFCGYNEVEIFSSKWWNDDQDRFLGEIIRAYKESV